MGLGVSMEQLDTALSGPVAAIVFDDVGIGRVAALLEGLADTDFTRDNLNDLLATSHALEDWRVGEALAEHYLCEHQSCHFPWPDGRDERKRGSSLPGADLVGFHHENDIDRFAFGEVKTSGEASYPPGAAYGRHGLKQQMEDLRDRRDIRDGLVLYLAHRAAGAAWRGRFQAASAVYLRDTCDVRIFGLLVRDVSPHENDLRARVNGLGRGCPSAITIQLFAIYLPAGSIATLASKVVASRQDGGAV
ncbi:MAG: hypothetical protein C3F08_06670 [Candidatus Methylomirabilota bacterium]|nr:MAG: hypothetical protein C3F08_06670 [candidate division NC10 bacterium]